MSRSGRSLLQELEPEGVLVLRPSKREAALMTAIGLAFVCAGAVSMSGLGRLLGCGFFGLCALVGLINLTGVGSYLELRPDGFTCCSLGRGFSLTWRRCSAFRVGGTPDYRMVVFDQVGDEDRTLSQISRALAGGGGALPDSYGMRLEALANLLNAYRDLALGREANPSDAVER